ncbi:MAG: tRNA lysidine(34) synthetase TilS [Planctomycetes bacterium]|nr:tRNA lysidine(34) synthetase TilS [Planctomycetota bacterium]
MNTPRSLEQKLAERWSRDSWRSSGVLLAVSGGADSVALFRLMAALCGVDRTPLRVFHLNHMLREAESDRDEQFVNEMCSRFSIRCHLERLDMHAEAQHSGESIETASRSKRYTLLQQVAERHGVGYVATAHTADDQVETILHRIVRGTGVSGLSGIPRIRSLGPAVTLIRPLLDFRRADLVDYLNLLEQPYCQDASNADVSYTRNRIRHELLPLLRENYNPGVDAALLRLGSLGSELNRYLDPEVQRLRDVAVQTSGKSVFSIDCRPLMAVDRYLVRELLISIWVTEGWPRQAMGFAEWESLRSMIQDISENEKPARMLPGGISARRDASRLVLAAPQSDLA